MKSLLTLSLLLLVGAGLAGFVYGDSGRASDKGSGHGKGRAFGKSRGHGMVHGMRGGGHGMVHGMRGGGHGRGHGRMPFWNDLPAAIQDRLEQLHLSTGQAMLAKRLERRRAKRKMRDALGAYPLQREAAEKLFQSLADIRRGIFQLRLDTMTQMQQILGKERWEKMHSRTMEQREGSRQGHHR